MNTAIVLAVLVNLIMGAIAARIVQQEPELNRDLEETDYIFIVILGIFFLPLTLHQRHRRCQPQRVKR